MHKIAHNAQDIHSDIVSTLQMFLSLILFFSSLLAQYLALLIRMENWELEMSASGCRSLSKNIADNSSSLLKAH